jgi:hypothetical protein
MLRLMMIVPLLLVEIYYSIYLEVYFLLLISETHGVLLMPLLHSVSNVMLSRNSHPQSLGGLVKFIVWQQTQF